MTPEETEDYLTRVTDLARDVDTWETSAANEREPLASAYLERALALYGEGLEHGAPLALRAWCRGMALAMKDCRAAALEADDERPVN